MTAGDRNYSFPPGKPRTRDRVADAPAAARHRLRMTGWRLADAGRSARDSARDHVSDVPVRTRLAANRVHVAASNAWYYVAARRIHGARQGISNARNQRTLERGRRPRTTQAADVLRSSVPFYRNRISPATGRPNRMARELGRTTDASLAKMAPRIRAERARRRATPEQVETHREAQRALGRNSNAERARGVRDVTGRSAELNHRVGETLRPLSTMQRLRFAGRPADLRGDAPRQQRPSRARGKGSR